VAAAREALPGPAERIADAILAAADGFRAGGPQTDDVTLVVVRLTA
jgi:serine phosphatase RsbU (regulator of sigma subunit)